MFQTAGDPEVWAIPWQAETYVIHYRRDLLQKAGVDEAAAFRTHADLESTAKKLAQSDVDIPVELTLLADRYGTLHALASWLWGNGCEFFSEDGRQSLLNQPKALDAIRHYFGLLRLITPQGRQWMIAQNATPLFHMGHSAMTFGTMNLTMPQVQVPPEVTANWGWAALPQPCFVGGSHLAIWKHTRNKRAALQLIEFLTRASTLITINRSLATLPPRLALLNTPEFTNNPMLKVMADAIKSGRTYQPLHLWGLLEDKIVSALLKIGSEILARPEENSDEIIRREIDTLSNRLGIILSQ